MPHVTTQIKCIDVSISLGGDIGGVPAGQLYLRAEDAAVENARPQALDVSTHSLDVEIKREIWPATPYDQRPPRQVITPRVFVDIVTLSDFAYEVRMYDISAKGQKGVGGFYEVLGGSDPLSVWRFENPSGTEADVSRLQITETRDGLSEGERGQPLTMDFTSGR